MSFLDNIIYGHHIVITKSYQNPGDWCTCACVVSSRLFWNKIRLSQTGIALPEEILLSVLFNPLQSLLGLKRVYLCIWLLFITPRSATRISILNYLGCGDPVISALPLLKDVK